MEDYGNLNLDSNYFNFGIFLAADKEIIEMDRRIGRFLVAYDVSSDDDETVTQRMVPCKDLF